MESKESKESMEAKVSKVSRVSTKSKALILSTLLPKNLVGGQQWVGEFRLLFLRKLALLVFLLNLLS